jgi:predicted nucleic acid-binding protein
MVIVDSSVWIEASRRNGDLGVKVALENLLDAYEVILCGPVRLEVLGGARQNERQKLSYWFNCLPYRAIQDGHWELAIRNAWTLRDAGLTLPWNDILIATLALDWDMPVYAQDTHFEALSAQLGLRLYRPGYGGRFESE